MVGVRILPATLAGLERSSSEMACGVGRPAAATCW